MNTLFALPWFLLPVAWHVDVMPGAPSSHVGSWSKLEG